MGMDCVRNIEVYTDDIFDTIDSSNLNKYGKLTVGDIVLVYRDPIRYREIIDIDEEGCFVYKNIPEPKTIEEALNAPHYDVAYRVDGIENLPYRNIPISEGDIVSTYRAYYKYDGENWNEIEDSEVPRSWKPVTWKSNNKTCMDINSGMTAFVRKYILANSWDNRETEYTKRGLPNDITDDVKKNLEGGFDYTYIMLSEFRNIIDIETEKFKNRMVEAYNKTAFNKLNDKVDLLLKHNGINVEQSNNVEYNEDEYDEEYDSPNAIFDEYVYDLITAETEQEKIETIMDCIHGWVYSNKVRIIYALFN